MKLFRKLLSNNIIGIASGGGHLSELQSAIPKSLKSDITYITFKNGHTIKSLVGAKYYFIIDPHDSKIKYLINFIYAFLLFVILRPKIIISTGAGIAIPFMMIGKFFGSKLIFIETGARVYTVSKTGNFMYKYADKFFVQYEVLLKKYPKAILGSLH
ncbi:polysaccharide biosynthesis protein [bacterium]|jgi:beta-1,4-N-acetylglucosaminyltransferase|nr:polysaccharide biosynthesis protein [bacterium]